jgi:hypothetical protein
LVVDEIEECRKLVKPEAFGNRIGLPVPIDEPGVTELRQVVVNDINVEPFGIVTAARKLFGGELTTLSLIAVVQGHDDADAKRVAELLKLLDQ